MFRFVSRLWKTTPLPQALSRPKQETVLWACGIGICWIATSMKPTPAAERAETQVERGKYLVHHVAMCVQCHTPKDSAGNLKLQQLLKGSPMPVRSPYVSQTWGFEAPNLRGLPSRWGDGEFEVFLQTGRTPNRSPVRPPMPPFRMTAEDAAAVAAYLDSLVDD